MRDWKENHGRLEKRFLCKDFKNALAFVNEIGKSAEALGHHPDITIQNYRQVFISITTHDAGNTITEKDRALAKAIEAYVSQGMQ